MGAAPCRGRLSGHDSPIWMAYIHVEPVQQRQLVTDRFLDEVAELVGGGPGAGLWERVTNRRALPRRAPPPRRLQLPQDTDPATPVTGVDNRV